MPPYGGSPYAAYYAHGGVYGHSAIPVVSFAYVMLESTVSCYNQFDCLECRFN